MADLKVPTGKDLRGRKPVVLLAEDDTDFRQLLSKRLTLEGMWVVEVQDGYELKDYLRVSHAEQEPDVVVTDVNMPGESGLEVVAKARELKAPVVLITSYATQSLKEQAARAGVVAIFEKPFAVDHLVMALRKIAGL